MTAFSSIHMISTVRSIVTLLILALISMGASCTPSVVYDPALGLPAAPMEKETLHAGAGVAMLPHARPNAVDRTFEIGGEGMLRYAFSDKFSMQGKWFVTRSKQWRDGEEQYRIQQGVSVYGIFKASGRTDNIPWAVIPAYSFIFDERTMEGQGGALWFAIWPWTNESFSTYFAAAPAVGFHPDITGTSEWGLLLNAGEVITLSRYFSLNVEAATSIQFNGDDIYVLPAPSLSLVWRLQ